MNSTEAVNDQPQCPSELCQSQVVSKINCLLGILAIVVFEPMAVLPYFCRTIRIYTIFKAQDFYFKMKRKPDPAWFRWIKEPAMFRLSAIALSILLILGVSVFVGFVIHNSLIEYMPSYTIYMCFMKGMCSSETGTTEEQIERHVNSTLVWLIVVNFFGNLFFVTCIYKLRNIKNEFNIRYELLLTFLVWFVTTQLAIGLYVHQADSNPNFDWVYLILVFRSVAAVILTSGRPLYLSFIRRGASPFLLLPPNQESIESLDIVL